MYLLVVFKTSLQHLKSDSEYSVEIFSATTITLFALTFEIDQMNVSASRFLEYHRYSALGGKYGF